MSDAQTILHTMEPKEGDTIVVWFSCGAASATALDLVNRQYGNLCIVRGVNNPVAEEDEDNLRFAADVERYTGVKIEVAKNFAYPDNSAESVWEKRKFMSGPEGAPCTGLLKKEARRTWEDLNYPEIAAAGKQLFHVFGFTKKEEHRHAQRVADGMNVLPILIDRGMSKGDCFRYIKAAGLELPRVYSMPSRFGSGYPNANCIGCVKATSPTYWNHVRETFPDVFEKRAKQSRRLGAMLVRCHPRYLWFCEKREGEWYDIRDGKCLHETNEKTGKRELKSPRIFLDELPPDAKGRGMKTMNIDCGILCENGA